MILIGTASSMGVNVDNLTSAYVSLTKQGIATAEATTYTNSMLNELGKTSSISGKALKEATGKSFKELMDSGMSLADVLQILQDEADKNGVGFNEMFGSAEASKAGLAILQGGVEDFNNTVATMGDSTDTVSEALEKLDTPSAKANKALNQIKNSAIQMGTSFISAVSPVIDKLATGVEKLTTWFDSLDDKTKTTIATVLGVVTAIAPVLLIIGKVSSAIGTVVGIVGKGISLVGKLGSVIGFLTSPMGLVVVAIVALIAIGVALYKNWDKIKAKAVQLKNNVVKTFNSFKVSVSKIFNAVKTAITKPFTAAWNLVKKVVDKLKNAFKFKWSLPKLKLPHVKIKGKFSLTPPQTPKFSIDWYKKAMDEPYMFTDPTVFGLNPLTGTAKVAGEAGDEIMYGRANLMRDIRTAVTPTGDGEILNMLDKMFRLLTTCLPQIANMQVVLDDGTVVGRLAPLIDRELGRIAYNKDRGNR